MVGGTGVLFSHHAKGLPNGVERSDGCPPASFCSLLPNQVLSKVVGQLTRLPHQGFILKVFSCNLLVDVLQTHQESAMTKAVIETDGVTFFFFFY